MPRIEWQGHTYTGGVGVDLALGRELGKAQAIPCDDTPGAQDEESPKVIVVRALQDVNEALAVASVNDSSDQRRIYLADGYIITSPEHPLHDAVYGSPRKPNERSRFDCGERVTFIAAVRETPTAASSLSLRTDDAEITGLLRGGLLMDAGTRVIDLEREGAPYVEEGQRIQVTASVCRHDEERPFLLADRIEPSPG